MSLLNVTATFESVFVSLAPPAGIAMKHTIARNAAPAEVRIPFLILYLPR
jgi:hypothetical protein